MTYTDLNPPIRTIMTPGPVEAEPRVLRAMSTPIIGQFDPAFLQIMNETSDLLKYLFNTKNEQAYAVDGSSRSGLEALLAGMIKPGDKILVPIFGRFGHLIAEIAERYCADVHTIEADWGTAFDPEEVINAVKRVNPKIVAIVHGETSTGILQPLKEIGQFCREQDVFLIVDAVATVGGVEFRTDEWFVDAVVTGTQKCLSVPSGMAPITYNERVAAVLDERKKIEQGLDPSSANSDFIRSNYLDLSQIQAYWSPERINHHTEATSMLYALREGLRIIKEEGLQERWSRHLIHEKAIMIGLEAMGMKLFGDLEHKMPVVTNVIVPEGMDESKVRATMLQEFGVEIAGAFGPLRGKIWRVGSMGYSARKENVYQVLHALESTLQFYGADVNRGDAIQAAMDFYMNIKA